MSLKNLYKSNHKLLLIIVLLALLSVVNTLEGYIYSIHGVSKTLLFTEFISFILTVLTIHNIWCLHSDGKCSTVSKKNITSEQ